VQRSGLELADIFRAHGPAWRHAQHGHLSLGQLKVMSAIERCRTAALGGHELVCPSCAQPQIAYNSCRNRHCPKCQGSAAQRWLKDRQADLLPVEYYHVVFTLPAPISAIAYTNKERLYGLLFDIAAETLRTIAADPKHLGARIGVTLVLHTWGSQLTHHPHVHGIVPGGGLAIDTDRWVSCRPGFFLSVRVLSRLFRRRFLEELQQLHRRGELRFFAKHAELADPSRFAKWLAPLRQVEWVVYAKRPFAGPAAVLGYLSRYTHRVAISNSRLIAHDERGVSFRWKDYRTSGRTRYKTMTLPHRGVPAALPAARAPTRLPSHPSLRAARECSSHGSPRHGTCAAERTAANPGRCLHRPGREHASTAPVPVPALRGTDDSPLHAAAAAAHPRSARLAMLLLSTLDSGPLRPLHALRAMARGSIVLLVPDLSCNQSRPLHRRRSRIPASLQLTTTQRAVPPVCTISAIAQLQIPIPPRPD
jgi:hypothetical protein